MIRTHRFGFVGKRLLHTIPLLIVVLIAVFAILKLVPGDPARQVAGPRASEATVAAVRATLGLDQPLWQQFVHYLTRIAHGDLGVTAVGGTPIAGVITANAPVTLTVLTLSSVFTIGIAVGLAVLASRRPGGVLDRLIQLGATFGVGIPAFWLGVVLLAAIALPTGWFPVGGWGRAPIDHLRSAILPAFTLSISTAPILLATLRAAIIEVTGSDYYTAAQAAGLRGWRLIRTFVLRNAAVPAVALLAALSTILLSGVVVVEATFGLPGLGLSLVQGAKTRDLNTIQGLTLVFSLAVVLLNLLGDVLIAALDPRVEP